MDISDSVMIFDRLMEEINIEQYLKAPAENKAGRRGYNSVKMLKTVLFGFMDEGYISLRKLEENCRVNLRYMYLMEDEKPSYHTFGDFINNELAGSIENIFNEINRVIFEKENVDLDHIYISKTVKNSIGL